MNKMTVSKCIIGIFDRLGSGREKKKKNLFSHFTSSLFSSPNLLGHLDEHGCQTRFQLQLFPQCPAAAVLQRGLDLTEPAVVVGVSLGVLQQPVTN